MSITPLTRGLPGSQGYLDSINDIKKVIIEVPKFRVEDCITMNLLDTGLNYGAGTANTYPAYLHDGCILGKAGLSQYTSDQKTSLDIQAGGRRGGTYFDFSSGGAVKNAIAIVFTNGYVSSSGMDNPFHLKTGSADPLANTWTGDNDEIPTNHPDYRPGRLDSNAVNGLIRGEMWIRSAHVTERSLSAYSAGDSLCVSEGLWKKGVPSSGNVAYGEVIDIKIVEGITAAFIRFDFTNGHII